MSRRLTAWLERQPAPVFAAWAILAAFSTYFCMYAFRKPFAAAAVPGEATLLGSAVKLKILYVVSQVIGYTLSKFMGIKVVSEASAAGRARAIVGLIGAAWLALLLFAILPAPWNALAMFLNGIPLGMVWGLVFGFLEGRRLTEVLGAGLSASYIIASGVVKSAGVETMAQGIPDVWMPFVVGAFFVPLTLVSVWMLKVLPPPNAEDERLRVRREPMDGAARKAFILRFGLGVFALTASHTIMTAYRDFRDNFAADIWKELGYGGEPSKLATTELWVAFGVLVVLAALYVIRSNRLALLTVHAVMLIGSLLVGISTWLFQAGTIGPELWMTLVGLGLYTAYVPFGSMLFDRLIAAAGTVANAGFLIYLCDAFGYLGSVGVLLYKNFGHGGSTWLSFFTSFSYLSAAICAGLFVVSLVYFYVRIPARQE